MNVDENKFINVTEPLYAYILGLIWADGSVGQKNNGVKFYTTYPDADYFKCVFFKSGNWKEYTYKRSKNWKTSCNLYITNKVLKKFLSEMNYCSKNATADKILSHIPTHLQPYWMLGLIDGDGYVAVDIKNGLYEIQIAGPVDQNWEFLENYCQSLKCDYTIQKTKNKKGQGSVFRIIGRRNVYIFGESIWKQKDLGLLRKREKYEIIKEKALKLTSKYEGVSYNKKMKKYKTWTPLLKNKKRLHLGYFHTEDEAFEARRKFIADSRSDAHSQQ